jgi:two-component system CitB family response regulator
VTLGVVVVDDDFRVADLHARFVTTAPGFTVLGTAHTAAHALELVARLKPDLVLLDNHLPDRPGLSVASELLCDVMIVTADASSATVRGAFAAGAVNVIVKPFTAELLAARLGAYAKYRQILSPGAGDLGQQGVDRALAALRQGDRPPTPKGQSPVTARLVADRLRKADQPATAAEVAADLGISRATAQRYLASLAEEGRADVAMRYGSTGRPEHRYSWKASASPTDAGRSA